MLISDILFACMLLVYLFAITTTMFFRERSSETMTPGPLLAIRKTSLTLHVVYFEFFKLKKYKNIVS
jgi:hypothetical protein